MNQTAATPQDDPRPDERAILEEELAMHERVKQAVRTAALAKSPDMSSIKERLVELRDEAISASERDLPALFQQLYTHHSLAARNYETKLPDMRAPYFAHVRLLENGKTRDILIGYQTFIDSKQGVTIVDWRHAALAKVFFNFREGDDYELELPGRVATGVLAVRRVITFDIGELTGVNATGLNLARPRGGAWKRHDGDLAPALEGGAGAAINVHQFGGALTRKLPDVSALLDPEQYALLNQEDQGALLILGGAGSGKTTVALHRMALLSYRRPRFYRQQAMGVVVPEHGLVRLVARLLGGLGLGDVAVSTFDSWVRDQGQHILKGLPKRLCEYTPPGVIGIKRHPAMTAAIGRYCELVTARLAERLKFLTDGWAGDFAADFAADPAPLMTKLDRFETRGASLAALEGNAWRAGVMATFFKEARAEALDANAPRSELFTNRELLDVLRAGTPKISEAHLTELVRHTRKQLEDRHGVGEYDQDARTAVDGAVLEEDDFAGTIDVEDFAVLLNVMLALHGRVARKTKSLSEFKHLVVDEAQDLAPLELKLLGQSLANDATVTVAGDAAQQSDPAVVFHGWDEVLNQLEVTASFEARLATNYRCPRPVAEFGHKILGALAPAALPRSIKAGRPVIFSSFPSEGLAIVAMTEALNQLFAKEHLAAVAIICENEDNARRLHTGLSSTLDVRLVVDGEFSFKPGIDVTDVAQVKGLEFDYVIIPDANLNVYPDTPVARRALHIAVTRAVHQLWVMSVGRPSDLLA